MRILVSEPLEKAGLDILQVEGWEVDCRESLSPEELLSRIPDYDALIVRSGTRVTAQVIDRAERLKVIGRAGAGLDNVDTGAAAAKRIVVLNTPSANTTSTAELTLGLMLALARHIPQADVSVKSGRWDRVALRGVELRGKELGVIGLGRIGLQVARLALAFGMKVSAYDPFIPEERAWDPQVEEKDLDSLLRGSDFVTLHVPRTPETENLISDREFGLMKPSCRLVNCARGGVVDEPALIRALKEKRISGCALDVYAQEPPDFDREFFRLESCITVPHIGAATAEAKENVAVHIAAAVRDTLLEKKMSARPVRV